MNEQTNEKFRHYKQNRGILIDVALGKEPADLVLQGGQVVFVDTGEILPADVAIKGERIALVGDASHTVSDHTEVVDVSGKWIVPGLMDAHLHIESSLLTVTEFARLLLPHGVTAIFADPHEVGNVVGVPGIRKMWEESQGLPLKVYICPSSLVPTAIGLETSGATIGPDEIAEMFTWDNILALGEIASPFVLAGVEDQQQKISQALAFDKIINGHTEMVHGADLNAFLAAGVQDSHNASTLEAGLELLRLGARVIIMQGSVIKRLPQLAPLVTEYKIDPRHILLCTDDMAPDDIVNKGHIDQVVREAIQMGIDPIVAVQMATLNCAEHYRLSRDYGSVTPGKIADLVVLNDLKEFVVNQVYCNGQLVAENGKMVIENPRPEFPEFMLDTIHLKEPVRPEDFRFPTASKEQLVNVRVMTAGVVNKEFFHKLSVIDGNIQPDPDQDILKICVVERHFQTGRIGRGFVQGFGLNNGAIASSIAHNHHNLIVVGTNDEDMAAAINYLAEIKGGFVAIREGKVIAVTPLPICGLLSIKSGPELVAEIENINTVVANELGSNLPNPLMELSFMGLPVVETLHLTDMGLIHMPEFEMVPLELD